MSTEIESNGRGRSAEVAWALFWAFLTLVSLPAVVTIVIKYPLFEIFMTLEWQIIALILFSVIIFLWVMYFNFCKEPF